MIEITGVVFALLGGTGLIWAGWRTTNLLTRLVRPARPPGFVALHMTAVWSVGISSALCGVTLITQGIELLRTITQSS